MVGQFSIQDFASGDDAICAIDQNIMINGSGGSGGAPGAPYGSRFFRFDIKNL